MHAITPLCVDSAWALWASCCFRFVILILFITNANICISNNSHCRLSVTSKLRFVKAHLERRCSSHVHHHHYCYTLTFLRNDVLATLTQEMFTSRCETVRSPLIPVSPVDHFLLPYRMTVKSHWAKYPPRDFCKLQICLQVHQSPSSYN